MTASSDKPRDFVREDRDDTLRILKDKLERAQKWVRDLESMVKLAEERAPQEEPATPERKPKRPGKTGYEFAVKFLENSGSPQPYSAVVDAVLASGRMVGKEKARTQAEKSVDFAIAAGTLIRDPHNPDMVGLPLVEGQSPA